MQNSQNIKVGDQVCFYWTATTARKIGTVIKILETVCEVFVDKDGCCYGVDIDKVKKI